MGSIEMADIEFPRYENVLTRIFGDSHNMRVLGFLIEHPLREYTIVYLHERLDISRDKVSEVLSFYQSKGYVERNGSHGPYGLDNSNEMVLAILNSLETMGDVIHFEWNGSRGRQAVQRDGLDTGSSRSIETPSIRREVVDSIISSAA